jgi:hypothetical protein
MLRAVITFLIAVPMLMPPGMCICQLAPAGQVSGAKPVFERQETVSHSVAARGTCRCESCREQQAPGSDGRKQTPTGSPAQPEPGKHAPGCPALLGDMPTKMAATALTLLLDASPVSAFVSAIVETDSLRWRDRDTTAVTASPPPLFLAYCSLLI